MYYFCRNKKDKKVDSFIVSARKYRPATFDTVVGQKGLTTTLKNAIRENKLAHAYLFCGPRGVGKTTCARIFAKTINCEHMTAEGEACNECESCRSFNEGRSFNIHELDAASNNSVDDIRNLIEQVRIPPQIGKYKVFIIDEVHMLSTQAFNAFLKTLEEPPAYAKFILATTERQKVLPTILSRCQTYDFYRISINDIVQHLAEVAQKEGVKADADALNVIAQKADGGMRDALSLFDQMVSYSQGNLTYKSVIDNLNILDYDYFFRFTDMFLQNKTADCLLLFNEILQRGFDGGNFIGSLAQHFRDLLVSKDIVTLPLLDVSEDMLRRYKEQVEKCSQKFLYRAMKLCNDCDLKYRDSKNKRLLVELTLIQLSQLTEDNEDDDASAGRRPAHLKPIFGTASAAVSQGLPNNSKPSSPAPATQQQAKVAAPAPAAEQPQPVPQQASHEKANASPAGKQGSNNETETTQSASAPYANGNTATFSSATISQANTTPAAKDTTNASSFSPTISRIGTVSIKAKRAAAQVQASTEAAPSEKAPLSTDSETGDKPFTYDELETLWRSFARELPKEEVALARRMEGMQPTLSDDQHTFSVVATNKLIEKELLNARSRIVGYLRKHLNNQRIEMVVDLQETQESEKILSRSEQFREMAEQNKSLKLLAEALDLDLA